MNYWQIVFEYFLDQGFPEALLRFVCINSYEAFQISAFIEKRNPRAILEIGTFIGLSTGVLALASPSDTILVCVDPNLPVDILARRFHYLESRGSLWFLRNMLEQFGRFQKTVILEGCFSTLSDDYRNRLITLGGNPEAIATIGEKVGEFAPYDLVFLDGDHCEEAVYADLSLVCHYISEDALIVLHDLSGDWGIHVFSGVSKFLQEHPEFSVRIHENLGFLFRHSHHIATLVRKIYSGKM
jgi:hypothetical protein